MTAEQVDELVRQVEAEYLVKQEMKLEHDPETKKNRDFDVLHARAVEGRTWVDDLPEGKKFTEEIAGGNMEDTRPGRAKEMDAKLNEALRQAEEMQKANEGFQEADFDYGPAGEL